MAEKRIEISEPFNVSADVMFAALTTASAIRHWWGASRAFVDPTVGGTWATTYGFGEGGAEFVNSYKLLEIHPPKGFVLGDGVLLTEDSEFPQPMGTRTEFIIEDIPNGCMLRIIHILEDEDMVDEDEFESTADAWKNTFEGLRRYFHYNSPEISSNSSESTLPSGFDNRSSESTPSQPASNAVDGGFRETESSLDSSAQNTFTKKETESRSTTSSPTTKTASAEAADPKINKPDEPEVIGSMGHEIAISSPVKITAEGESVHYRAQIREESFGLSPEEMFDILLKPSAIKTWWGPTSVTMVPEVDGILTAVWGNEDEPERHIQANILELKKPERLVLKFVKNSSYGKNIPFDFADDAVIIFQVKQNGNECTLRVEQTGFPCVTKADQLFLECGDEWRATFDSIRKFISS